MKIPDQYKLPFLGASFFGCLSTMLLPYNSLHTHEGLSSRSFSQPLNQGYCNALHETFKQKCWTEQGRSSGEYCETLEKDLGKCTEAVVRAYKEISFSGCVKQSAAYRACAHEYCDVSSEDGFHRRLSMDDSASKNSGDHSIDHSIDHNKDYHSRDTAADFAPGAGRRETNWTTAKKGFLKSGSGNIG
eukprot:CAMPEP_0183763408 /NCGR_PEP_ID=MMETSP0739-20130205/9681_1 /TAXON_ID=385413 /ORGANISM="Thalassiosira miniscula, Strain CCMP1093" /LENGTH=187 /DNA_ID=CAMNT_0026001825 /DNA_START=51 /DNA_END=615 /DNA_ORIENTATION=+